MDVLSQILVLAGIGDRLATPSETAIVISAKGLQSWLEPFQLAKPFDDEFLWIEVHRIAWLGSPAVDTIDKRQSILIRDENMEPPPAFGIGFLTIDEPMAMLDQD